MAEKIVQQPQTVTAQQRFTNLPAADVERSTFDRSAGHLTTMDAGKLIPVFLDEVLPGDTFNVNATIFCRLATPLKPIMDNMQADLHYFFVPNRLVWENFQRFMGERDDPNDNPDIYTVPEAEVDLSQIQSDDSLANYFGLPLTEVATTKFVNALPFRGYKLIWNEWYRDQNLQSTIVVPKDDGGEDVTGMTINRRGKRKDYFTSALPWPQKGDPVYLPLGTTAPVLSDPFIATQFTELTGTGGATLGALRQLAGAGNNAEFTIDAGSGFETYISDSGLYAELSQATAATINDIRTAFQIQRMLERDARGGTRYTEILLSHFNVQSADARLQRPEYLGGGTGQININPVASTVPTDDTPQANLSATGTGVLKGGFTHSFTEHGFIFGIMSVRADLRYQNGVDRMWSRRSRYDYYWPTLSHLGEQQILNEEIFVVGGAADNNTWGYQERYGEYRFKQGRITGKFRSNHPQSLDVWHLAEDFNTTPPLNSSFITETPPVDRVIAVPSEPHFLVDCWFQQTCSRAMPVYSVPGLVDHF